MRQQQLAAGNKSQQPPCPIAAAATESIKRYSFFLVKRNSSIPATLDFAYMFTKQPHLIEHHIDLHRSGAALPLSFPSHVCTWLQHVLKRGGFRKNYAFILDGVCVCCFGGWRSPIKGHPCPCRWCHIVCDWVSSGRSSYTLHTNIKNKHLHTFV